MIKKTISVFTIFVMILSISITAFAASPKYKSTKAYVQLLEEYDVEYTYQKGELNDEIINFVTDEGEYRKTIDIDAQFVNTEDEMTLYSFGVIEFVPRDYADVLDAVNMLNGTTNYGCFYIAGKRSLPIFRWKARSKNIRTTTITPSPNAISTATQTFSLNLCWK